MKHFARSLSVLPVILPISAASVGCSTDDDTQSTTEFVTGRLSGAIGPNQFFALVDVARNSALV